MSMGQSSMSPADVAAVVDNNRGSFSMGYPVMPMMPYGMGGFGGGFGMDGSWIWIILLLAIFGGFGNGFGGYGLGGGLGLTDGGLLGNNATKSDLSSITTANKIDNVSTQLCNGFADVNNGLLTGFGNVNLAAANNTSAIVSAIDNSRFAQQQCCCDVKSEIANSRFADLQNTNAIQSQLAQNNFAQQQCCCDIRTAITNSDNLNFRNTCDIENMIQAQTVAIKEDGEKTRALLVADKIEALNRELQDKDRQLQTARFDASQLAQTANIVNQLQPVARPAYLTCSPYQSQMYPFGNFGYGYGNQFV